MWEPMYLYRYLYISIAARWASQQKTINMKKNKEWLQTIKDTHYKRLIKLNIRDVNAKCCKQTNTPHKEMMYVLI